LNKERVNCNVHSISGKSIGLPLVTTIGIVRDHAAQRITWHSHKGFEILFLLDGATAYEFKDGRSVEVPGGHFLVVPPKAVHRGVHDVRMPATICGIVLNPKPPKQWKNTPFAETDLRWIVEQFKKFEWTVHPFNWDLRRLVTRLVGSQKNSSDKPNPLTHVAARWMACAAIAEAAQQMITQKSSPPTVLIAAATAFFAGTLPRANSNAGFGSTARIRSGAHVSIVQGRNGIDSERLSATRPGGKSPGTFAGDSEIYHRCRYGNRV
jgi:hypothetical protein